MSQLLETSLDTFVNERRQIDESFELIKRMKMTVASKRRKTQNQNLHQREDQQAFSLINVKTVDLEVDSQRTTVSLAVTTTDSGKKLFKIYA